MKIIGIICKEDKSFNGHKTLYSYTNIFKKVLESGGYPIGISLLDIKAAKLFLKYVDGIIFSGGDDYTQQELELVKYLYENDIPTLGICLGMQTMAVAFNGSLSLVKGHNNTNHEVILNKNSKIYEIIGKEKITVNSRHNYKVENTNLNVTGKSDVIEVIEDKDKQFFIGVEWHPESLDNTDTKKLFDYFVNVRKKNDIV
ncbi:MAG: gamma-glutamyl-gamma-aminobutyrate hydrolase family protein [Bacilli bacterium]|nr:gamma-glutamyl-gamma-aminobutyrate hydrolase family protein [Bacilli bacterium]